MIVEEENKEKGKGYCLSFYLPLALKSFFVKTKEGRGKRRGWTEFH